MEIKEQNLNQSVSHALDGAWHAAAGEWLSLVKNTRNLVFICTPSSQIVAFGGTSHSLKMLNLF